MKRDFEFSFGVGSGIERAVVKKMRLVSRFDSAERITLEADSALDPHAIYALLDRIGKAVPLGLYDVSQVELAVLMAGVDGKRPKKISFRISYPNSCSLKYEAADLKLRTMLEQSGIEPLAPPVPVVAVKKSAARAPRSGLPA